jgi:hypothetical protein
MMASTIPGYRMGDPSLPASSLSGADLDRLSQALLLTDEDRAALREAKRIIEPRVDRLLDVWYGFVGGHDFLLEAFSTPSGPDADYLARVRARFSQWVLDTLDARFDARWAAYQAEVGHRHAGAKNVTDGVTGAPDVVPFRYVVALVYPIFATLRPFLEEGATDPAQVERMHQAWLKAVLLNVALWSEAYVRDDWF